MTLWCTILTGKEWLRGTDPVWVLVRTRLNSQSKTAWARMSHGGCEIHVHQPIPKLCEDHSSQCSLFSGEEPSAWNGWSKEGF